VLALTGSGALAALAGCLGDGASGDGGTPTDAPTTGTPTDDLPTDGGTDDSGGTRPSGSGGPGVSIVARDDASRLAVEPSVEVVTEAASETSPPQLRTTVTNPTDRTLWIGEGRAVVFAYVSSEDGQLVLLPADGDYPAEPDCWRLAEPIAVTEEYRITELEPGASTSQLLDLYALPGEDACLPVGEFRFTSTFSVTDEEGEVPSEGGRWGFSVTLE
jgi:hypothetical protein